MSAQERDDFLNYTFDLIPSPGDRVYLAIHHSARTHMRTRVHCFGKFVIHLSCVSDFPEGKLLSFSQILDKQLKALRQRPIYFNRWREVILRHTCYHLGFFGGRFILASAGLGSCAPMCDGEWMSGWMEEWMGE